MDPKHQNSISPEQLRAIGDGFWAYVKPIGAAEAERLAGQPVATGPKGELFALYSANGVPISISSTLEAAMGNALEHELVTASLH